MGFALSMVSRGRAVSTIGLGSNMFYGYLALKKSKKSI